jgi:hypothetical protein
MNFIKVFQEEGFSDFWVYKKFKQKLNKSIAINCQLFFIIEDKGFLAFDEDTKFFL